MSGFQSGSLDLDNMFITNNWLVDQYVGGQLYGWGKNGQGQLGLGNTVAYYSSPVKIGSLTNWKMIAGGTGCSFGIKTDGTLWAWGSGGLLPTGNTTSYSSPVQIGLLTNWATVSGGSALGGPQGLAIKTDGSLWGWGINGNGQLGLGNTTNYSSPVQVGSLTNWNQVACGRYLTFAIKTDNSLWAWGSSPNGELGLGNTTNYSSPVQVGSLTNWKQVACGYSTASAIKTDGTLWTWGTNNSGQLGTGDTNNYSSPVQVGSLTNWKFTSSGNINSFAGTVYGIKTDGTLWGIGECLASNDSNTYSSPIQIGSLTNWKQISTMWQDTFAIKTDGTLWAWGVNGNGTAGQGNTTSYSSPVQIGTATNWKQATICGTQDFALAIAYQTI